MTVSEAGELVLDSCACLQGPPLYSPASCYETPHVLSHVLGCLPYWDSCSLLRGDWALGACQGGAPGTSSLFNQGLRVFW